MFPYISKNVTQLNIDLLYDTMEESSMMIQSVKEQ